MQIRPPKKFVAHPFEYHQEIDATIDSLTNLGSGIARVDGWVVFVPFALPGEKVRVRIYRNDKNCSYGDLVEVLAPSPARISPRCPLFGACGGCQYQHLEYSEQLKWKSRQVAELLRHMAGIDFDVNDCLGTDQIWNYRSKITPHFDTPRDGEIREIGFRACSHGKRIVDVPHCDIAMREINAALPMIRESVRHRSVTFRRGSTLLVRAAGNGILTDFKAVAEECVGSLRFQFLAGDFFQNNPFILQRFTDYVADRASESGARHLVDAYCGSGLFALCLAHRFESVRGVEVSETSCEWARRNAEENHIHNAQFLTASAEAIFADIGTPSSQTAVVIDPPRKGCTREFLEQLTRFDPKRIVYVSCDPATQVRDLKHLMAHGYRLVDVQPFDLFPHTRHLECVMSLEKGL